MRTWLLVFIFISSSLLWAPSSTFALGVQTLLTSSTLSKQRIHNKALKHFDSLSTQDQTHIRKTAYDLSPFLSEHGVFHINLEKSNSHSITIEADTKVELSTFCDFASQRPSLSFLSINIYTPDLGSILSAILSSFRYSWDSTSKKLSLFNVKATDIKTLLSNIGSSSSLEIESFTIPDILVITPKDWEVETFLVDMHAALKERDKQRERKKDK